MTLFHEYIKYIIYMSIMLIFIKVRIPTINHKSIW